jgi:tRNA (guanine-N7-)-methyltransferase
MTFPDPRPRKRDIKRRLTSPRFIEMFKKMLRPNGFVRLKTDNSILFDYTLEEIQSRNDITDLQYTRDLYASELRPECFEIRTRFEEEFAAKGETIKYLRFRFK